jgi:hypothetical protein
MIYRIPTKIALVLIALGAVFCFSLGLIGMGIFMTIGAVACLFSMKS